MNWTELTCPQRFGDAPEATPEKHRTDFQRDYDRLIFSAPFRRLQDKTQVFPLPGNKLVHNRLTHSLEVASVGRSLGNMVVRLLTPTLSPAEQQAVAHIPSIVAAACLAHDMGNPPFGHSGEEAIRQYFIDRQAHYRPMLDEWEWADLVRFEGNANALRLLTQQLQGRRSGGFRLSYAVLASIIKYPYPSTAQRKKFGYFKAETSAFELIAQRTGMARDGHGASSRHPLAYLVEAADDICYQIMDIEDAHRLGLLGTEHVLELFRSFMADDGPTLDKIATTMHEVTDPNEQVSYLRAMGIGRLVGDCAIAFVEQLPSIMRGETATPLTQKLSPTALEAMQNIEQIAINQVYKYPKVVEIEIAGYRIMGSLLDAFCAAALNPQNRRDQKVASLLPSQYRCSDGNVYKKILSVLDFVAGMTDDYALKLFRLFQGINLPSL
ncbi:MAG: dNTP triphosphohydrolase [Bacteroidales bacterium]|nr:dNTP triphosphohydrolase [Bacteroidales bacterium]